MTVINTNIKALYTQSALKQSERASHVAMEQLSTGKRINSSKDDAAGLAIAARMTQNIKGMNQSIRNSGDAIALIQVAEGATNEITAMLQRMSELAVQSSNSTYSTDQRGYLDQEFQQLKAEIVRISETHEWNGFPILNGKAGTPVGSPITNTILREVVAAGGTPKVLAALDLQIVKADGTALPIPASIASNDTLSNTVADSSSKAGSAIAIAAAINSVSTSGVRATANGAEINGTKTTVSTTSRLTALYINGTPVLLSLTAGQTLGERRQYVIDSINAGTTSHGVIAGDGGNGGLSLKTIDGRNLSVWFDDSVVDGSDFGLGLNTATASNPPGVTGVASSTIAAGASVPASTVYGTITLNSINTFTVRPGANPDSTYANFTALGFKSETLNPKNIGRLSFQVGPSPDQLIHIDLADFGQSGDITGPITSNSAPTNILTVQAANDVTQSVNKSLDKIAQTRASMGAVMNRLEHVIDNLTNVVMNSEASRSQIEDADYAKASTELARTQIMQQAATAVLAQANTSQQTVLKLLQA